jgi:hypothetical protein
MLGPSSTVSTSPPDTLWSRVKLPIDADLGSVLNFPNSGFGEGKLILDSEHRMATGLCKLFILTNSLCLCQHNGGGF